MPQTNIRISRGPMELKMTKFPKSMECDPGKDDVSAGSVFKAEPEIGRGVILEKDNVEEVLDKDNVEEEYGCDVTLAVGGVFLEVKIETMVDLPKNKVTSAVELNPQVEITEDDLLTILPPEIALKVFMFMDPKDLLKLAQTCHILRFLSENDRLWDDKCKEASLSYCLSSAEEELLGLRDTMNSKLHEILKSLNRIEASFESSCWKANFLKHLRSEQEKLLKSIKSNLKGLVLSEKNGYTEKKLWGHYMEFIGQDLERESIKLGFSCMAELLASFRDIIRKGYNQEGEQVYKGIADESTKHIAELIGKTPFTKKKRKGTRGRGSVLEESKDKVMMVYRVEQILAGKKDGVWSTMVEKQYEKKHREQLPSLWWEKVNVVRVEPLSEGSKIMIVFPIKDQSQSNEQDTNDASPSDSGDILNGSDNEAMSSLTSQNHRSLETEVEFGEAEDNFFHVLPELSPPDHDSWAVYISVVASTEEVYVKFIGDDFSEKFDEISQMMDNFYDNVDIPSVEEVILEQIYAAKADDEWHRVQATDFDEFEKVSCWFIDCGDEDVIDKKDLKELDKKFLAVPAQAFQISLHGVKDTTENTTVFIEKLNDELVGKSFIAKVKFAGDNEKVPAVILFDTSKDEEGINMNEKIQEFIDKQIIYMSSDDADSTAASSRAGSLSDVPEDDTTAASNLAESLSDVPKEDTTVALSLAGRLSDMTKDVIEDSDADKNHFITEVQKSLPIITIPRVNEDFDVRCCLTFSPSNFIVQPLDFADQLEELMTALVAFYNNLSNQSNVLGHIKEGEFVAAQHQDGRWYRAKVVREIGLQTGLLVVRSVDYGENFIVELDKLKPLAPEFRHLPMQAVLAKLAGVHPPAGDWTQGDISWFHGRVDGQDFVSRVTGVSAGVTGEMVLELVLIDTSHPEVDKYVAKELMDRK